MISRFCMPRLVLVGLVLAVAAPHAFAADAKSNSKDDPKNAAKNEDKLRPDLAKPMAEIQDAIKQKNYQAAIAKLNDAEAATKDKTPYETYIIDRMRGAAYGGAGDLVSAAKNFSAAIDTGKMPPPDQPEIMLSLEQRFFTAKDYPNTIVWGQRYLKSGGTSEAVKASLAAAEFSTGDFASATRDVQALVAAADLAGQKAPEQALTVLAASYLREKDEPNYMRAVERLVTDYPSPEYWASLLSHLATNSRLSDQMLLNIRRLQRATGVLTSNEYASLIELDLQEAISSEAKNVADEGAGKGLVPKATQARADGAAAVDRAKLDRDAKEAAGFGDGNVLSSIGYTYVGFGDYQKGIAALQQGIAKGGLKHPEETKMQLGIAYYQAGQLPKAIETFNSFPGSGPTAQLAHYWAIKAKQGA